MYPQCVVLMQMGDFYETAGIDALVSGYKELTSGYIEFTSSLHRVNGYIEFTEVSEWLHTL